MATADLRDLPVVSKEYPRKIISFVSRKGISPRLSRRMESKDREIGNAYFNPVALNGHEKSVDNMDK